MADLLTLASQLRAQRAQDDALRQQRAQQGGVAMGGSEPVGQMSSQPMVAQSNQQSPTTSPLSALMDGATKYNQFSKGGLNRMLGGGAGSSLGATGTAYAGSGMGGTGFGLGGSLVAGGASGEAAGGLGGLLAGSGAAGAGGLGAGTAAAGGAGAGAAGAGALGGLAAAGPFAALAAAVLMNEEDSRKRGLRSDNPGQYGLDLLTGRTVSQDIDGKWAPKTDSLFGGLGGKLGLGNNQRFAGNVMTGDFGNAWKNLKDSSLGKIFKIF